MNTFLFLSCCEIEMTIMTSYFRISDDVINFLFHKISTHCVFLPSFSISWLDSKKRSEKIAFLIKFLAKHSRLIDYHGNNEWPIPKLLTLKDGLYIGLKSQSLLNRFWDI